MADPLSVYLPIVIAEGRGATITDVDGNTFIDFTGGVGCLNVGHSHPRVVEAAQEQLEVRPHRLHDRPVRGLRHARRAAARRRAVQRAGEGGVLQRRHRGGRERDQVRARLHGPPRGDRLRGRLPRPDAALALAHVEDAPVQGGPRAVRPGGLPRSVPERLPRAEAQPRGAGITRARADHPGRRGDRRRDRARARARRGRLRRRADGVHAGRAPHLRRARDRPGRRRGPDRVSAAPARCSRSSTTASSPI